MSASGSSPYQDYRVFLREHLSLKRDPCSIVIPTSHPQHRSEGSLRRGLGMTYVRCCVAGGGPAGMMLGLLLARSGVEVLVLEKHKDFLRDFRGDTVHPSTLEIMRELGLLEEFLKRPHQELTEFTGIVGGIPLR